MFRDIKKGGGWIRATKLSLIPKTRVFRTGKSQKTKRPKKRPMFRKHWPLKNSKYWEYLNVVKVDHDYWVGF